MFRLRKSPTWQLPKSLVASLWATVRRRAYSGAALMDFRSRCTDSRSRAARSPSGKADGRMMRGRRSSCVIWRRGLGHDARRSLSSISITSRRTASVIMLASATRSRWLRLSRSRSRAARIASEQQNHCSDAPASRRRMPKIDRCRALLLHAPDWRLNTPMPSELRRQCPLLRKRAFSRGS
jgi:hypothetical protein